jgi:hypothetical protein
MMMKQNAYTEEQARKLWCPMARYRPAYDGDSNGEPASFNRHGAVKEAPGEPGGLKYEEVTNPSPCCCIASQCMMWRWFPDSEYEWGCCGLAGEIYTPRRDPRTVR